MLCAECYIKVVRAAQDRGKRIPGIPASSTANAVPTVLSLSPEKASNEKVSSRSTVETQADELLQFLGDDLDTPTSPRIRGLAREPTISMNEMTDEDRALLAELGM